MDTIDNYDVIFVGYPNWWGTMPLAVFEFLRHYDLKDKVIMPFCTHEGSGMGRSESDLKELCKDSIVLNGFAITGSQVFNAKDKVSKWIHNL